MPFIGGIQINVGIDHLWHYIMSCIHTTIKVQGSCIDSWTP